jgi:hypothetical protein
MIAFPWRTIAILIPFSLLARFAMANDQIAWGTPTTISTDADVSTYGTLFGAINNGGDGVQGVFVNNVPFSAFPTTGRSTTQGNFTLSAPDPGTAGGFTDATGPSATPGISSNYQTLLRSSSFASSTDLFLQISNLTIGQRYQIQVWANDSNDGVASSSTVTLAGSPSVQLRLNDTGLAGGRGQYAIGTFTASAATNSFQIIGSRNASGHIFTVLTAVQVRALPAGPPPQLSNRGFYRGSLPASTGGNVLLFVHGNNSIAAYVASHNKFSSGGGTIAADGTFSFTMTLSGTSIQGSVTPNAISGSYTPTGLAGLPGLPESFNADRVTPSGMPPTAVAGKYEGNLDGVGKVTVLIDPREQLTLAGVNQITGATIGGGGLLGISGQGENPSLANRAPDWTPNDREDAGSPKFTGTFKSSPGGYDNEIVEGSINFHRGVIEGNIGGKYRGVRQSSQNHLANISTRGTVTTSSRGQVIGGFVIQNGPKQVLIRALGPSLRTAGVPEALDNPRVELFSGQTLLAENDDWPTSSNRDEIIAMNFAPPEGVESALLIRLEPGAYTAVLSGVNGGTGVALVEVYEIIRD